MEENLAVDYAYLEGWAGRSFALSFCQRTKQPPKSVIPDSRRRSRKHRTSARRTSGPDRRIELIIQQLPHLRQCGRIGLSIRYSPNSQILSSKERPAPRGPLPGRRLRPQNEALSVLPEASSGDSPHQQGKAGKMEPGGVKHTGTDALRAKTPRVERLSDWLKHADAADVGRIHDSGGNVC